MSSRRGRSLSSSSSDEPSDYKDEFWRDEDSLWVKRTDRKYITFRWSSGCGSGKDVYTGHVRDHMSSREGRKRVDYLVIQVDGEENAYKLGKDIRQFTLFSDKKCSRPVAEWSKLGWSFHKEDIKPESKIQTPSVSPVMQSSRSLSLSTDGIEISNSFSGGFASTLPDFYFYRSAAEICGKRDKNPDILSPTQTRE